MKQADIREQILHYYAGRLTSGEKRELLERLQLMTEDELQLLYPASEWEETEDAVLTETELATALHRHHQLRGGKKNTPVLWYAAAACLAGALVVTGYFSGWMNRSAGSKTVALKTIQVQNGEPLAVTLADGSKVTIHGGSTLLVPEIFTGQEREIFLQNGEAFFDIKSDPAKPFIVHTGNMDVRVLGTSFSIRDYNEEADGAVTVRTGKVAVNPSGETGAALHLLPGSKAALHKASRTLKPVTADTTAAFGWMQREYIFRGETLREIIKRLKHGYQVTFRVDSEALLNKRFSATFRQNTMTEIMEQLRLMGNIQYRVKGDTIIIH